MFLPFFLCLALSVVFGRPQARIVGGENATQGEFPMIASLQLRQKHHCGATVLDENWLLTTSHCVDVQTSNLSVVAGTVDLSSGGTRHSVIAVVVHSEYDATDSRINDIALIRVKTKLPLDNTSVAVAELAAEGQDSAAGSSAIIIGWGRDAELGERQDILQKLNSEILDQQRCANVYSALNKVVRDTEICARAPGAGSGPCQGDNGSPILVDGVVVGVTSWQAGCGWPTVYTRVASYVDWIQENKK